MNSLNIDFTSAEQMFCILAAHPSEGLMYRGQIVWDDGSTAIMAHHDPATDGVEWSKLVLIEEEHRNDVSWIDDLATFRLACHQLKYCHCNNEDARVHCPAEGMSDYSGPYFEAVDLRALNYFSVYADGWDAVQHIDSVTIYTRDLAAMLDADTLGALDLMHAIRRCGDKTAHRRRYLSERLVQARQPQN